jgi:hypothetical protein
MTAQIDGDNASAFTEMDDLRREDPMIAGPAVDQDERWALRIARSRLEMREVHAIPRQENRLQLNIGKHKRLLRFASDTCSRSDTGFPV